MGIGAVGIDLDEPEHEVNWRGVGTIAAVGLLGSVLYATGTVAVPFLVVAPLTVLVYVAASWLVRDKVRAGEIG